MTLQSEVPLVSEQATDDPIVEAHDLRVTFPVGRRRLVAVDGVDLTVARNETVALVGESGSGKSTIARTLIRAYEPESGTVRFDGADISHLSERSLRPVRRRMQMVQQDPFASLDPRMTVEQIIAEPLRAQGQRDRKAIRATVDRLLGEVGLDPDARGKRPVQFSGGQRQRISIARALAPEPELLIADEPLSALDVSVQAQLVNLLQDVQARHQVSYLLISHDLALVNQVADRTVVVYLGRVVEEGPASQVFRTPQHPYTAALVSAVPSRHAGGDRGQIVLRGEPPSAIDLPSGCRFHTRCPIARPRCAREVPPLVPVGGGARAACFYSGELHASAAGTTLARVVPASTPGAHDDGAAGPALPTVAVGTDVGTRASRPAARPALLAAALRIGRQVGVRLVQLVITLWVLSTVLFFLLRLTGNPAEAIAGENATATQLAAITVRYGLDKSLIDQYGHFLQMMATLDFGTSYTTGISALTLVMQRLWPTVGLVFLAFALNVVVSVVAGCLMGARRGTASSKLLAAGVFVAQGIPFYVVSLVLIQLLSDTVDLLPTIGDGSPAAWILPACSLAWFMAPRLTRVVAVNVANALDQDYVRVARAAGAGKVEVVLRHALPNGLMAAAALAGTQLAYLVSGTLIVEEIFAWPGMGRLLIDSITHVDFPVVEATVFVIAVFVFVVNALTDIGLLLLDPRTRPT